MGSELAALLEGFSPQFTAGLQAACEGATGGLRPDHFDRGVLGSLEQLQPHQWGQILTTLQHLNMAKINKPGAALSCGPNLHNDPVKTLMRLGSRYRVEGQIPLLPSSLSTPKYLRPVMQVGVGRA